jgi:hypothetical protein
MPLKYVNNGLCSAGSISLHFGCNLGTKIRDSFLSKSKLSKVSPPPGLGIPLPASAARCRWLLRSLKRREWDVIKAEDKTDLNKSRHLLCGWVKLARARVRVREKESFVVACIIFIYMKIFLCFIKQASFLAACASKLCGICQCT